MLFISGGNEPEIYRNRKQYFSKNVQVVAGPSLEILDIVTGYAGSSHDQHVFNMSLISIQFCVSNFWASICSTMFHQAFLPQLVTVDSYFSYQHAGQLAGEFETQILHPLQ